jgi:hypothetical protein
MIGVEEELVIAADFLNTGSGYHERTQRRR